MGKSDLIDKINARVKSQMSTLTPRSATKPRPDEKDDRAADVGEKRITNAARGTVVVRRRGPQRGEGEPVGPGSAHAEPSTTFEAERQPMAELAPEPVQSVEPDPVPAPLPEVVEVAPVEVQAEPVVSEVAREPVEPVVVTPPVEVLEVAAPVAVAPIEEPTPPVAEPAAPVVESRAVEVTAEPVREEVVEPPPVVPVAVPEPVEPRRPQGPRGQGSQPGRGDHDSYARATLVRPPAGGMPQRPEANRAPVAPQGRAPALVTASTVRNRGPVGERPAETPAPVEVEGSRGPAPFEGRRQDGGRPGASRRMPEQEPVRAHQPSKPLSIEDVLAQETGRVREVREAIVVRDGKHLLAERQGLPPRPVERVVTPGQPAGGVPAQPAPAAGAPAAGAGAPRKLAPSSPTAVKEIANDERKKEKAVAKGVPRPVPGKAPVVDEEAERLNRAIKAKKPQKKREVVQGREVVAEAEPQFRKQRRVVVKREKAKTKVTIPKAIKRIIKIEDAISVGELAHRMGIKAPAVIKKLIPLGVMATINQSIDHDTASVIAADFGYEVENVAFNEGALLDVAEDTEDQLVPRPPVVTIMGHVDHGKTTLLDAIRDTDVAGGEAGGITQHIGAYTVELDGERIVFLDTPGHEAFTSMRARGAQVTDIVVLVVAADDGVMPQTVEALNHAKAAGVPILVAVNKIDKPGANPDRIRQELAKHDLVPEDWGGQTLYAEVSAKQKKGVKELLELILLQAEMLELAANPDRSARATVIESCLDRGRGPVATVLVSNGTLRVGDIVVVGAQFGKVRAMIDDKGKSLKEAGPSMPVEIVGLSGVPDAGDALAVVEDLDTARSIAENRSDKAREQNITRSSRATLEDLFSQMQKGDVKELKVVLKTDVQGSLEALQKAIADVSTDTVKTSMLHAGVGNISESDVALAAASRAVIVGFSVRPDANASALAEQEGVQLLCHSVIYEALDDLKKAMLGLLKPVVRERIIGHAEVRETFSIPKIGVIAGCSVTDGKISRGAGVRLFRNGKPQWEGKLGSLKRFKDDAKEVEKGYECGIGLDGCDDIRVGDVIEAYTMEESKPVL